MAFLLKRKLGYIKRGIYGFLINRIERNAFTNNGPKMAAVVGKSSEGREIDCYEFGHGGVSVIFVSAIHGNETGTVKLANRLMEWLDKNKDILGEKLRVFVIPCLNPDGHSLAIIKPDYLGGGRKGRLNNNGVDLNRNFPTKGFEKESTHSFGKGYQEKEVVYCGERGASEPETQALVDFIKQGKIRLLISLHNSGRDVMGGSDELSQRLAKIYSEKTGFRIVTEDDWKGMKQSGTAKEWCEESDISYLESEGSTRWGSDWSVQGDAIKEIIRYLANNGK